MRLYLAGGEVPSHRKLLAEQNAPHVAISFLGLKRRIKNADRWKLADKFHDSASLFVDSGAYSVNNNNDAFSQRDLRDISALYRDHIEANLDRLEFFSEFDALPLGRDWIENQRNWWVANVPVDKFLAIWHPDWGIETLQYMCQTFARVGVPQTALGGRNLTPLLNSLVANHGVKLHGVGMTKVEEMSAVSWHSVASTSWTSPQRFGDTIVWSGGELHRYPKAYKERARKRHRTLFERIGLDPQAIEDGDTAEVLRLSLWSWRQLEDSINRHSKSKSGTPEEAAETEPVTAPPNQDTDPSTSSELAAVDTPVPVRK